MITVSSRHCVYIRISRKSTARGHSKADIPQIRFHLVYGICNASLSVQQFRLYHSGSRCLPPLSLFLFLQNSPNRGIAVCASVTAISLCCNVLWQPNCTSTRCLHPLASTIGIHHRVPWPSWDQANHIHAENKSRAHAAPSASIPQQCVRPNRKPILIYIKFGFYHPCYISQTYI